MFCWWFCLPAPGIERRRLWERSEEKAQLDGRAFCVATDAVILGFRCFWRDRSAPERCDPGDTSPSLTVCTLRIGWQRDRAGRFWPHMTQRCADQYDQEHVDLRLIAGVQRLLGWRPHRSVIVKAGQSTPIPGVEVATPLFACSSSDHTPMRPGAGEYQVLGPGVAPDFHVTITFTWGSYV